MRRPTYSYDIATVSQLGMELVSVANTMRRALARLAEEYGLSDAEWGILAHMRRSGENVTQKDLAWRIGINPTAVVRVLANMEKAGRIRRITDDADNRNKLISLTEDGRRLADILLEGISRFENQLFSGLGQPEIEAALSVLRHARNRTGVD